ncbi:MAG: ATP-dependent Clp protease adaptor ClpS [Candidatus Lambdaproteobacteria bacterium]|nr:ATP-dependent Clp protease adaptor ClpS [Candidatus Lambdaproteobacteria bacterium]
MPMPRIACTNCSGWISPDAPPPWAGWRLRQTTLDDPSPRPRPPAGEDDGAQRGPLLAVRVMDNAVNTYAEVIEVCCRVLGVSVEQAYRMARTIDSRGSCVVCVRAEPEARSAAAGIGAIGIEVRLEPCGAPI